MVVMNRSVCEKCRRFDGKYPGNPSSWLCAEVVYWEMSGVIPGHKFLKRDNLHPMNASRDLPPEWCERILEQTILSPEDKADIDKDANLVYDGNNHAGSRGASYRRMKRWSPVP
jgi:hypothetical protein